MRRHILAFHHDAGLPHGTAAAVQQPVEQSTVPLRDDVDVRCEWRLEPLQTVGQCGVQIHDHTLMGGQAINTTHDIAQHGRSVSDFDSAHTAELWSCVRVLIG